MSSLNWNRCNRQMRDIKEKSTGLYWKKNDSSEQRNFRSQYKHFGKASTTLKKRVVEEAAAIIR